MVAKATAAPAVGMHTDARTREKMRQAITFVFDENHNATTNPVIVAIAAQEILSVLAHSPYEIYVCFPRKGNRDIDYAESRRSLSKCMQHTEKVCN